jgi:hypothetical protein
LEFSQPSPCGEPVFRGTRADIDVAIYKVKWVMKGGAVVVDKTKGQVR